MFVVDDFVFWLTGMFKSNAPLIWRLLILLQFLPRVLSWGKEGHYATCKIAEVFQVTRTICFDEIRHNPRWRWTGPLHYIDTPDFKCNYDYCRDCHDFARRKDRCAAGAIYNYSTQLSYYGLPTSEQKYNLTEALLFLSHFIGDIHQLVLNKRLPIFQVWDNMIIESALKKFYNLNLAVLVETLRTNILVGYSCLKTGRLTLHHGKCVNQIRPFVQTCKHVPIVLHASESIRLACKFAYRNATPGSTLGDDYFLTRLPIVEKRLAQGGVRLAAVLNRIFVPLQPFHLRSDGR
ncbi:hypothetical protein BHM03_00055630 [Ensete ventricosum]|nr:hypothetical protein BHM03_00055630 [Ensete ventricosum]